MRRWLWLGALAPGAVGIGASMVIYFYTPYNPILYMRISLSLLVLILGLGLTIFSAALVFWARRNQRRAEGMAAAFAEERRRFLRRLDHEMKNPLTAIRAGLANLADTANEDGTGSEIPVGETPEDCRRQEALESIEAQTLRLGRLAADLRKLAELEVRLVEQAPVDITQLLTEAFTLAQDGPGAEGRRLNLSIPKAPWPLPKVTGDPDLLFLAVHNLLENALKFTRAGDTVELRAFEDGSSVVIEVADTGPGIPAEEQPQVWEELFRGQAGRGTPGSGLGLALVRAIAERHNGQASLRSRPGQGTVFSLRLPAS